MALILFAVILFLITPIGVLAEVSIPQVDQTPLTPLLAPDPIVASPRYLSGIGEDNNYTIFYEDRNDTTGCAFGYRIFMNQTSTGAFGFAGTSTATNICDTHLKVKDWPITIGAVTYSYRAWGSVDNNAFHTFYVSNDLVNWTQIYYGTGMFDETITGGDAILYGFHDIVQINGNYIGFVESAGGNTYIAWSDNGDWTWTVMAKVGGSEVTDIPLSLSFTSAGPIPTGNFLLMEINGETVYGKLMVPGNRSGAYLAINRAAAQATTPALAEAAFLNPVNWTWSDNTTGLPGPANAVLTNTLSSGGHDIREVFSIPTSSIQSDHVILYTANYGSTIIQHGIGCAASNAECLVIVPSQPEVTTLPFTGKVTLPQTGFAPDKMTSLPIQTVKYQPTSLKLIIPAIGINSTIVGVPYANNSWDVSWLGNDIGYLYGSSFPGWNGNSVLAGHVYNTDGNPGVFHDLGQLKWGDSVILQINGQDHVFEVQQKKYVADANVDFAFKHEESPWLTLITCKGFDALTGEYHFRQVVRAVLVTVEP
jgi:LPXTG-site transpeptidase (sortase) family protein